MAGKKVIAICQSGGDFKTDEDGSLSYKGGVAHAMDIDQQMKYKDFKNEVAEMFNSDPGTMSIKYFVPGNKKTLITISNDKDLKRMIKFQGDSSTADIYVTTEEVVVAHVPSKPARRSRRTTLPEEMVPVEDPPIVAEDVMDDTAEPVVLDDTTHVNAHTDITAFIPPLLHSITSNDAIKASHEWQNTITGVGQRFNSVHVFREALRKYAIANQFTLMYKKNENERVTAKCKAEGCPWRIHASRLATTQLFCVKKMNATHTCEGVVVPTGLQATRNWVASIIKEKLKVNPDYNPKDIVNDVKQECGIQIKYYQAWRWKEIAKEQLQGSYKKAYKQLPVYCEKIMETNPGSLATFTTKEDSSFHRLFVSFHASLHGFQRGCRPLLFLDSAPLKSRYQGRLLTATAADGNDAVFPVAFAIVDVETDDNWRWFLVQLKSALSTTQSITFVADREKGLKDSIGNVFHDVDVHHGYCIHYLSEKLFRDLKGQFSDEMKRLVVEDFYAAAYAPKPVDFQRFVESVKSISPEAYNWIMQSEPVRWANAFFQGARYNHMTSNFGDEFYSWVSEAQDLPITVMVDTIRGKVMELIYTRRAESNQWRSRLTPFMEEKLEKENQKVCSLRVALATGNRFEVRGDSSEVVDLDHWDCSCKGWQLSGLPCCHAIAVMNCLDRSPYDYCSRFFSIDSYTLTYSESINPVPNADSPVWKESSKSAVTVTPPSTRRPPGRPPAKPFGSEDVVKRKRQPKCSRCKVIGHKKSTCKEFLLDC